MKKVFTLITIVFGILFSAPVFAENTNTTNDTEVVILYVDINTDSADKIADLLKGIGLKKATAIVEYRDENGPFEAVEDLMDVPGIGPSTLEKNRSAIRIGEIEN